MMMMMINEGDDDEDDQDLASQNKINAAHTLSGIQSILVVG